MGGPSSLTFRFNSFTTSGIPVGSYQELQRTLSKNEAQKQTIDPSIQNLQQTLAKRKEELENLEQDTKSGFRQERKAALEQQITMLAQRESLFLNRRATLQHEIAALDLQITALKQRITALEQQIVALEQQITTLEHRESIFLTLRDTLQQDITALKEREMNERALALLPTAEELRALDVTVPPGQKGVAVALSEGKSWPGGAEGSKPLFVRECYEQLFQLIIQEHKSGTSGFVISGSPGIGKSWSLRYFLVRFLQVSSANTVLYHSHNNNCAVIFRANGERDVIDSPFTSRVMKDVLNIPNCVYLFDPSGESPAEPLLAERSLTIVTPSPNPSHYKQFLKTHQWIRYVPVWSLDEILLLNATNKNQLAPQTVQERYDFFGGIPHFVLSRNFENLKNAAKHAISNLSVAEFCEFYTANILPESVQRGEHISHKLIHQNVSAEFEPVMLQFNSKQIALMVFEKVAADEAKNISFLKMKEGGFVRTTARNLFALIVQQVLYARAENEWRYHKVFQQTWRLVATNKASCDIAAGDCRIVNTSEKLLWNSMKCGEYVLPLSSNFTVADVLHRTNDHKLILFNATVAKQHEIRLESLMKAIPDFEWKHFTEEEQEKFANLSVIKRQQTLLQMQNNVHVVWVFPNLDCATDFTQKPLSPNDPREHKCNLGVYEKEFPEWVVEHLSNNNYIRVF